MYLLDTNIFLEWLLGRKYSKDCEQLLNSVLEGKLIVVCSRFSIYSICIQLAQAKKPGLVSFLEFILHSENFQVISTGLEDDIEILNVMDETKLDFDDALQYYTATQFGCEAIVTFDKDFKKTNLKSLTPKQAIEEIPK